MTLIDKENTQVSIQGEWSLRSSDQQKVVLGVSELQPGKYLWEINLINANGGEIASRELRASGDLEALEGPFFK